LLASFWENTCAPTANPQVESVVGKPVVIETQNKQTVEGEVWSFNCSALSSHIWRNLVTVE